MQMNMSFNDEYVTCVTCDLCYDQHNQPTFCQLGMNINPREIFKNKERAAKCRHWFPRVIGRVYAGKEYSSGDRWYEKDSMA